MKKIVVVLIMIFILSACGVNPNNEAETLKEDVPQSDALLGEDIGENQLSDIDTEVDKDTFQGALIKVVGDVLNVRNIPTTIDSTKIGVVLEESVFEVLEEAEDENNQVWYKIELDTNKYGWIAGWFTESFLNPNNYELNSEQWRAYNNIQIQLTESGRYKDRLTEDRLTRSLVDDFDLDGTLDIINLEFLLKDLGEGPKVIGSSIITYKDQTLEFDYIDNGEYPWGLTEIGVMDVDSEDQSLEFYIKEGDLADRVVYVIYRIDEGVLSQVDTMWGEILGVYGDGKIYYWGGHLIEPNYNEVHNPDMAVAYYDLEQKDYVTTEQIIGKSVELTRTVILYKELEDVIDGAPMEFESMLEMTKESRVALLEAGDKIKVLDIDLVYNRAKVSTASGYTGWIGGFHMVWD